MRIFLGSTSDQLTLRRIFINASETRSTVHELSIANSLVNIVAELAEGTCVRKIHLNIGALSCVHPDSLRFSFDSIVAGTPLADASLEIRELPVVIYCPTCEQLRTLSGLQDFRCPVCQTLSGDIRQGQELEIESIEVLDLVDSVESDANHSSEQQLANEQLQ